MTDEYGWSLRGTPVCGEKKGRATEKFNIIARMANGKIIAPIIYNYNTDASFFNIWLEHHLIPELQGRFPIRVELNNLTKEDFYLILKAPKNALTKQYQALFQSEDIEINFTDESLEQIAETSFHINEEIENIGARRLHTVMSKLLNDFLFDVPDVIGPNAKIMVTKEMVEEKLADLVTNKDLSQYIL